MIGRCLCRTVGCLLDGLLGLKCFPFTLNLGSNSYSYIIVEEDWLRRKVYADYALLLSRLRFGSEFLGRERISALKYGLEYSESRCEPYVGDIGSVPFSTL